GVVAAARDRRLADRGGDQLVRGDVAKRRERADELERVGQGGDLRRAARRDEVVEPRRVRRKVVVERSPRAVSDYDGVELGLDELHELRLLAEKLVPRHTERDGAPGGIERRRLDAGDDTIGGAGRGGDLHERAEARRLEHPRRDRAETRRGRHDHLADRPVAVGIAHTRAPLLRSCLADSTTRWPSRTKRWATRRKKASRSAQRTMACSCASAWPILLSRPRR